MKLSTAQKAAHWWADQLRNKATLDNGDKSRAGAMTQALAELLQEKETAGITPEQISKFETILTAKLLLEDHRYFYFGVDYGPDRILAESAQQAGINPGMTVFPWKTTMSISDNVITVSCGYQGKAVEI
jgi:hypothetical protein